MKAEDLQPKQADALKFMFGKQLTLNSIIRQLKLERALGANIVGSLKKAGLVTEYPNGAYGVSPSGRDMLIEIGFKEAERKTPGDRTGRPKKARVSEAPAVSVESAEHLEALTACMGIAIDLDPSPKPAPSFNYESRNIEIISSGSADSTALVHSGIAKLIDKLNGKPAIISNAQFKFAALNNLANGIAATEPNVANLLREVAMDIHNAAGLGGDQ